MGYLGPNGAGKTTTIKMLAGLLEPTRGRILLDGVDVKDDLHAYERRLGYVPEQSEIYPHLSAFDYLMMVGRLRGLAELALRGDPKHRTTMAYYLAGAAGVVMLFLISQRQGLSRSWSP